jgi:hypothetical protein
MYPINHLPLNITVPIGIAAVLTAVFAFRTFVSVSRESWVSAEDLEKDFPDLLPAMEKSTLPYARIWDRGPVWDVRRGYNPEHSKFYVIEEMIEEKALLRLLSVEPGSRHPSSSMECRYDPRIWNILSGRNGVCGKHQNYSC